MRKKENTGKHPLDLDIGAEESQHPWAEREL